MTLELALIISGIALFIISKVFEGLLRNARDSVVVLGLAAELGALVLAGVSRGIAVENSLFIIPLSVLLWCGGAYTLFFLKNKRMFNLFSQFRKGEGRASGEDPMCVPKLISGSHTSVVDKSETLFSFLLILFSATPYDDHLEELNHAWADRYYGLWFTTVEKEIKTTVDIKCYDVENSCRILGDEKGDNEYQESYLSMRTYNDIEAVGDTLTVRVQMGAANTNGGGAQLRILPKGVGVVIDFPGADKKIVKAMGAYVWRCLPYSGGARELPRDR